MFLIFSFCSHSQNKIDEVAGLGILKYTCNSIPSEIAFYNSLEEEKPVFTIGFLDDNNNYVLTNKADTLFYPLTFFREDYNQPYILQIKYLDEKKSCYKVSMGEGNYKKEYWIKTSIVPEKISWLDFYQSQCSIEMANDSLFIFSKPDSKSYVEFYTDKNFIFKIQYSLKPISIDGDWMEVELEYKELKQQPISGWIKWKNDKRILITYNRMCC